MVDRLSILALKIHAERGQRVPTAKLNEVVQESLRAHAPPSAKGRRFRVYYATQTGNRPFRIKLFCNREERLSEQYRRYLEAGLVEEFDLKGCPIYFDLVGKEPRVKKE